jgi:hypothetical protein
MIRIKLDKSVRKRERKSKRRVHGNKRDVMQESMLLERDVRVGWSIMFRQAACRVVPSGEPSNELSVSTEERHHFS